jgi:transposase
LSINGNGKISTVATLHRSGRPAKMSARAQHRMLNDVKNPRVSAKDLQKSLEHANISVDKSTIRKTLNKYGVHGTTPRKKPQLSKKKHFCTSEVCKSAPGCSTALLANIMWTDETTVE